MGDIRRRTPEPPPGPPRVQHTPGTADALMRELAPLLAEDGIDVDNLEASDMETLQAAMNRAVERRNMALFTPVGHTRDLAVTTLRLVVQAIAEGDTVLAGALLAQVEPESPDDTVATVSSCIGIALGLLDEWLPGTHPDAPGDLRKKVRLPAGHWTGERAAADILALAGKGRAFRSLQTLIVNQGGEHVFYGSALALAAATMTWATHTGSTVADLTHTQVR